MAPMPHSETPAPVLGVDVGGTFTDAVLVAGGRVFTAKALTTEPQTEGVLAVAAGVLEGAGMAPGGLGRFVHGMTVATNALLERRGGRAVLVTTEGFRDLLAIARQDRAELYTLHPRRPSPLVPGERCVAVRERVGPGGVETALTDGEISRVVDEVRHLRPEAVAVCLLWSFVDGRHEAALGKALRAALPGVPVVTSTETAPVFREYERASTTVIDAYVTPRSGGYLRELAVRCRAAGMTVPEIMQSSGGTTDVETAAGHAVRLLLSGPAGGVVAARSLGARQGFSRVLSFDMGGTSTDCAALVEDEESLTTPAEAWGGPATTTERLITGLPVRVPMVDVNTVSAGGGSIAWVDAGGALKVGPASAGARPGPACYGLGGEDATVTDALVVLGRIPPESALAGTLALDRVRAERAIARVAGRIGRSEEQTAAGVVRVATANMAAALRAVTLERGLDPRGFLLVAFGGAGGLHASDLAEELGMGSVMLPLRAGVLSALGLCAAPARADRTLGLLRAADSLTHAEWHELWTQLEDAVRVTSAAGADRGDSCAGEAVLVRREVEARYVGQSHELVVPVASDDDPVAVASRFHAVHERRYGYRDDQGVVEFVALRVAVVRPGAVVPPADAPPQVTRRGRARVILDEGPADCPVYRVTGEGSRAVCIAGPAVLVADDCCGLVGRGWTARTVADGFLLEKTTGGSDAATAPSGRADP